MGVFVNRRARIFNAASEATHLPSWVIFARSRYPSAIHARWAVMRALRGDSLSLPQVGRIVGRGHPTVLSGLRRAAELYATDKDFAALCDRVAAA